MDFQRAKEFLTILEEGSFKDAAKKLNIAPNVLSTRYQTFEKNLGVTLLERNSHGIQITEQGKIFEAEVRKILSSYEQATHALEDFQGHRFRSLQILLCSHLIPAEMGPFFDTYCRRYPKLFLELFDENSHSISDLFLDNQLDIAIAVGRKNDFQNIQGRIQLDTYHNLNVIVPNDHHLAGRNSLTFSDLNNETFLLYPKLKEPCMHQLQKSLLAQSGIQYHTYETESSLSLFQLLVPIGKGLCLWNWVDTPAIPNTQMIPIIDEGYETYSYLLYNPTTKNPSTLQFIEEYLAFRKEKGGTK